MTVTPTLIVGPVQPCQQIFRDSLSWNLPLRMGIFYGAMSPVAMMDGLDIV